MKCQDLHIKNKIEKRLINEDIDGLILFFNDLPIKNSRRSLYILSEVFPDRVIISDSYFNFIEYILTNDKFLTQQSISDFIRAINSVEYSEKQKERLSDFIFSKINILAKHCDFELNMLIINLLTPENFFHKVSELKNILNEDVKKYILNFLLYEEDYCENYTQKQIKYLKNITK